MSGLDFSDDENDGQEFFCSPFASQATDGDSGKLLMDPIHDLVHVDRDCMDIIDTAPFQRLRDLKQLGTCYFVFPGATHNRFEHCIGVSHLAGKMLEGLKARQPDLDIRERDIFLTRVGGLLHDLGHGPFSHVFDNEFMPRARPGSRWSHEHQSITMLNYLLDNCPVEMSTSERRFVESIISEDHRDLSSTDSRTFMYDVVANSRNGIDVDKFDYLARDAHNLGHKSSYNISRLMNYCRVLDNQICFHAKEVFNIYELFHTRFALFKQVYTHRVGKAVEYMLADAMVKADPVLNISGAVDDPAEFTLLTDSIISVIERSKDPGLQESRAIIKRLRERDIYKLADEYLISADAISNFPKVTPSDIVQFQDNSSHRTKLVEDDIIIHNLRIDFCKRHRSPMESVRFFRSTRDALSYTIPRDKVSTLLPAQFEERSVRIFVRDGSKASAARKAFSRYIRHQAGGIELEKSEMTRTPKRQRG